jgi:hypothetical protein
MYYTDSVEHKMELELPEIILRLRCNTWGKQKKQNIPDDGDTEKLGSHSKDYLLTVYYAARKVLNFWLKPRNEKHGFSLLVLR